MKIRRYFFMHLCFLLSSCFVIMRSAPHENADDYLVAERETVSSILEEKLQITPPSNKNYVLVFWVSSCMASINQIEIVNDLYEKYKTEYCFVAITNESEKNIRKNFKNIGNSKFYTFKSFTGAQGVRSSIRNLQYHNRAVQEADYFPNSFVVKGDSIIYATSVYTLKNKEVLAAFECALAN